MVQQFIRPRNHTSHKNFYFNEFVANVLRDVIGIVIFGLRGHGGCQRPKTPLGGQNYHERVDLLKKVFNESFSAPSKTPWRIQSNLGYNLWVERCTSNLRGHCISLTCGLSSKLIEPSKGFLRLLRNFHQILFSINQLLHDIFGL